MSERRLHRRRTARSRTSRNAGAAVRSAAAAAAVRSTAAVRPALRPAAVRPAAVRPAADVSPPARPPAGDDVLILGIVGLVAVPDPRAVRLGDGQPGGRARSTPAAGQLGGRRRPTPAGSAASSAPVILGLALLWSSSWSSSSSSPPAPRQRPDRRARWATASAPARPHHRLTADGRPDAGGAQLLPARQPVHPDPGRRLGGARRALGDPGRGGRPARVLAGRVVRARGAAGRGDRLRRGRGDRACSRPPGRRTTCWPSRSGGPGSPTPLGRLAEAGADNVRLCGVDAVWAFEHLVAPGGLAELWTLLPRPVAQDPAPQAPAGQPARSPPWPPPGSRRARRGGWPPTGPTTPSRCARCSTPSRRSRAASVPRWEERPVTRFERKGTRRPAARSPTWPTGGCAGRVVRRRTAAEAGEHPLDPAPLRRRARGRPGGPRAGG